MLRAQLAEANQRARYITPEVLRCIELYKAVSELEDKCYNFCVERCAVLKREDKFKIAYKEYKKHFGRSLKRIARGLEAQIGDEIGEVAIFGCGANPTN